MARAQGRDLSMSTKQAIEICNFLRNKKLSRAKDILKNVLEKKEAIPFKRFTNGVGHRKGKVGAGRYPMKASKAVLALLESVETNAQTKGLNTSDLQLIHICAHKAHTPSHNGRQRGRTFKRTHVEVIVKESAGKKKETKPKKVESKKTEEKVEVKKEDKPVEKKPELKTESKSDPKPVKEKAAETKEASQ